MDEQDEDGKPTKKGRGRGKKDVDGLDSDDDCGDDDLSDLGEEHDEEDFVSDSVPKKTQNKSDVLPDVSRINIKD